MVWHSLHHKYLLPHANVAGVMRSVASVCLWVLSVCLVHALTFDSLDLETSFCYAGTSSEYIHQVCLSTSSGYSQGHSSTKNRYTSITKCTYSWVDCLWLTSNATTVTEVRSASARLFAGTWGPSVNVITTLYYVTLYYVSTVKLFIVECGSVHFLCAMHVFEVRSSSSPPRLPLCQILFLLQPPLLK